jgi:Fe-S cluster assembly ATP-binding protein
MKTNNELKITDLHVEIDGKEIIKGLDLKLKTGEMHIIMGPNGSGKSTLLNALMGHPGYNVSKGEVMIGKENILKLGVDKRAHRGLFLAFQYPREIPGVVFGNFVRLAMNSIEKANNPKVKPIGPLEFYPVIQGELEKMKLGRDFIGRSLNEGFSGGEKKRAELVQMSILKPKFALLDEIDSGLDIDALKVAAKGIQSIFDNNKMAMLIITHYERILNYLKPDFIHIMSDGKIIKSGDKKLAKILEKDGYEKIIKAGNK